ncbi:MAG: glycogen/starch synthase [Bacteroidaceae bacterium]|nr:glycogen/starch synthase [Bacteroidaceae bacterium]
MKANKILFITQEITPFVQESKIANIGRQLPQATQESGHEIRIFSPKWGPINERRNQLHEVIRLSGMNLIIDDTDHPLIIKVASLQAARMQVYFIDNDDYFQNRLMAKDADGVEYSDNDERTIFFARGVLETVKKLRWCPDVIHCHGWISALVPIYVKSAYNEEPSFRESKVVFSLYDDNFDTPLPDNFLQKLLHKNMEMSLLDGIETPTTYEELAKIAIRYSDGVIINGDNISPSLIEYAKSLGKPILDKQTEEAYNDACGNFYETIYDE